MVLSRLTTVITRERFLRTAAVVFLHGQESSAQALKNNLKGLLMKDFDFEHIQIVYPQAPILGLPPDNTRIPGDTKELKSSWFYFEENLGPYNPTFKEKTDEIEQGCELVKNIVNELTADGINRQRIVLGGYDQGALIAMHTAFRHLPDVAGVFGLSTHLCPTSSIYRTIKEAKQNDDMAQFPPLYMFHGYDDELVKFTWAEQTANSFIDLDNEIQFDYCYGLNHDITVLQLIKLKDWILKKLSYKTKKERKEKEERKVIKK